MNPPSSAQIKEVVGSWAKSLATISAALGLFIAVLYFLRIGYLPLDSLSSLAALSGAIALVSLAVFAAFLVMWGIPTILCVWADTSKCRGDLFAFFERENLPAEHIGETFSRPKVLLFVATIIPACFLSWTTLLVLDFGEWWRNVIIAATILPALVSVFAYSKQQRGVASSVGPMRPPSRWWLTWRLMFAVAYGISGTLPLIVFWLLLSLSEFREEHRPWVLLALNVGGAVAATMMNTLTLTVLLERRMRPIVAGAVQVAITASMLVYVVVALGVTGKFLDAVMSGVSLRLDRVHLVLDAQLCRSLPQIGVQPNKLRLPSGDESETCALFDVTVVSRIGDKWRISCGQRASGDTAAFTIDSKHVTSWVDVDRGRTPPARERVLCGVWQ
jgi:hypothetical protein